MKDNLAGAVWRLVVFLVVCMFFTFALFAIFAQLRFQSEQSFKAQFTNVSGLENGQFVRIAERIVKRAFGHSSARLRPI